MTQSAANNILRLSTGDVAQRHRYDYFADAVSSALTRNSVQSPDPARFWAEMQACDLGMMSIVRMGGSPHRCYREDPEFGRDEPHNFYLILNVASPWNIAHRGATHLEPGDAIITDSRFNHDIRLDGAFDIVNLRLSEAWLRQWVPSPASLVGRRIPGGAGWGRALTAFASQLSPHAVLDSPLPASVLTDQVGALLALMSSEATAAGTGPTKADRALHERIKDSIIQRCAEPALTAAAVAAPLGISTRTLHRALTRCGETFGAALMVARVSVAVRMLESPFYRRLTTAEIGRRAGFADPSHFSRVIRTRFGLTPRQIRAGDAPAAASEE
jgi:AraC-like DNA-binding protein